MQITVKINEIEVTISRPELSDLNREMYDERDSTEYKSKEMIELASTKALELYEIIQKK